MAEALQKRGVPDLTASLAAELGIRAFDRAFGQWADPASHQTLTELTRQALAELRAATAALGWSLPLASIPRRHHHTVRTTSISAGRVTVLYITPGTDLWPLIQNFRRCIPKGHEGRS
jgi:hypothetical protein